MTTSFLLRIDSSSTCDFSSNSRRRVNIVTASSIVGIITTPITTTTMKHKTTKTRLLTISINIITENQLTTTATVYQLMTASSSA